MTNLPYDQNLAFDTELTLPASGFSGAAQFLGFLANEPVIILVKNQSNVTVFFADNPGATKGTTMLAGEEFVLDCRANNGTARNMGFPAGTSFYVTGAASGTNTGNFKVSVIYAH